MHAVEGALALLERGQPGLQGGRAVDRREQDLFVWRPAGLGVGAAAEGLVGDVGRVEPELGLAAGDELAPVAPAHEGQGFEVIGFVGQVDEQGAAGLGWPCSQVASAGGRRRREMAGEADLPR
jgi:hypothetical protein